MPTSRTIAFGPLAALLAAASLSGCGGSTDATAQKVDVKLTARGCDPANYELKSGPTTFIVTNIDSAKGTEFEILSGSKVQGEVENVTPGLKRSFSLNLKPGTYELACGSLDGPKGKLIVIGDAAAVSGAAAAAVSRYRAYVEQQTAQLVAATTQFTDAVVAGDATKAKRLYPVARAPYERIEPVAESFGDLDPAIDGRADGTPVADITGFHRIEDALWGTGSFADMVPVARKLLDDVKVLDSKVKTVDLQAAQIANGATELLGEVSKSKITGEEERYSHTDLWDVAANVDGSKAAISAVRPMIEQTNAELLSTIDARFAALEEGLAPYKQGDGWTTYTALSSAQTRTLSQLVDAVAEPVSQVATKVVSAS